MSSNGLGVFFALLRVWKYRIVRTDKVPERDSSSMKVDGQLIAWILAV